MLRPTLKPRVQAIKHLPAPLSSSASCSKNEDVINDAISRRKRKLSISKTLQYEESSDQRRLKRRRLDINKISYEYNPYIHASYNIKNRNRSIIHLCSGSLVGFNGECIVNAANEWMSNDGGLNGAVWRAGGDIFENMMQQIPILNGKTNKKCHVGDALISHSGKGHNKLQCEYIIHAVGPDYRRCIDGDYDTMNGLLYNVYKQCMILAKQNNIKSIAFCLISSLLYRGTQSLENIIKIGITSIIQNMFDGLQCFVVGYTQNQCDMLLKCGNHILSSYNAQNVNKPVVNLQTLCPPNYVATFTHNHTDTVSVVAQNKNNISQCNNNNNNNNGEDPVCKVCGKSSNLWRCSGCKSVWYCGEEHQLKDWPYHLSQCQQTKTYPVSNTYQYQQIPSHPNCSCCNHNGLHKQYSYLPNHQIYQQQQQQQVSQSVDYHPTTNYVQYTSSIHPIQSQQYNMSSSIGENEIYRNQIIGSGKAINSHPIRTNI